MSKCDLHLHSRHSDRPSEWILRKAGIPDSLSKPSALYESLRAQGHDFVTLTDHNTLGSFDELKGREGFFPGVEVTTYFPEDRCKVHLLVWNPDEKQFAEIEKLRPNLIELGEFLHRERMAHAVAHPLISVDGRMTADHFEKLLLLFPVFETVNGLRSPVAQEVLTDCLDALTPETIHRLSEKHRLDPVGAEPWKKGRVGGSNDHCGLYAGRAWTEVAGARDVESFLREIMEGRGVPHGAGGDPARFVNGLFHILFEFVREKVGQRAPRGSALLLRIVNRFLAGENPVEVSFLEKARYAVEMVTSGRILEFWKAPEGGLSKELAHYLGNPETRKTLQRVLSEEREPERRSFRLASKMVNDIGFRIVTRFLDRAAKGDVVSGLEPLAGVIPLGLATAPYLYSFHSLRSHREFLGEAAQRLTGKRPAKLENHCKGWLTDTLEDVNGVARTIRTMAAAGRNQGADLTILTSRPDLPEEEGVKNFGPVGIFTIPEYELQKLSFPPILEVIDHVARRGYTELILSTPGPMGLTGLLAAKLLGLRVSAIYHTDFPQYARFLSDDDPMVEGIAWNYMHWFYSQMDRVYVNSQKYFDRWAERGLAAEKLRILPRGLDTVAFDLAFRDTGFWKKRGAQGKVILYVGRISKEKELDFFSQVVRRMGSESGTTFAFVGEGPFLPELRKKLPQGIFTGALQGEDLSRAYASADLFVFPSTTDTYGNVVIEALASGMPVLVSDKGGPKELLRDPEDGQVVTGGPAEWENAIRSWLGPQEDIVKKQARRNRTIQGRKWEEAFQRFWSGALM